MAMLFMLTLPGLVVLLVAVAALERFGRWCGRDWLPWRRGRPPVSATGFDELTACFYAGKRIELEQRRTELVIRVDQQTAAPPGARIEFCNGVAIHFPDPGSP
jgi:hypothetical protein